MATYYLSVMLQSDGTFGRGAGLAGLVDVEIEHDQDGIPFVSGRSVKGLLVEEWANLRFALYGQTKDAQPLDALAVKLFGVSGVTQGEEHSHMHLGAATLPADLRAALVADKSLKPPQILAALTTIRRQTALDAKDGAPEQNSLRALRALIRGTVLVAPIHFSQAPDDETLALLAACVLGVRRGGSGRNRGRGRLALLLHENQEDLGATSFTKRCFARFAEEVRACR
ncbi:MAG: hypothetical protein EI684_02245 [Candidatus Viridilinea halotolerans]|uniref:CRISPR type III-associated protein domain-containing protein n=1 Tax=Candidatus Viridilinea halotolerans TaxID=2491704 RepID=A0A426U9C1_9CHLR|nr:MAG: hypothetical protein EI684_02245 [Candidatus Viridilinea halotolerans]